MPSGVLNILYFWEGALKQEAGRKSVAPLSTAISTAISTVVHLIYKWVQTPYNGKFILTNRHLKIVNILKYNVFTLAWILHN